MTVSSTSNRKTYTGDGVTVAFATSPVVFFDEGDLTIYTVVTATGVATQKTITTHYTVSGGAGSTGTVTMLIAPAVGETLVIVRELDLVQEVDFVNNEATDAEVAEDALDKLTMMAQQLSARLDRSLALADSDVSGASTEVPVPVADGVLKWNAAGTALESVPFAGLLPDDVVVSAFMETVLDDTTAAAARTTLGAAASASPTFTGQMQNADGTGALPSYSFSSGSNRGMFTTGANNLSLTPDGTTHTALINSSGNHQILLTASTSGAYAEIAANNSSNTASSQALLSATVAGASAADPYAKFVITGGASWSIGNDNSDSDAFKISRAITLGTAALRIDENQAIQTYNVAAAATGYAAGGDITLPATGKVRALNTAKAHAYITYSGGVPSVTGGGWNVGSLTDTGTGDVAVAITNALADANFTITYGIDVSAGVIRTKTRGTTSVSIEIFNSSFAAADINFSFILMGN